MSIEDLAKSKRNAKPRESDEASAGGEKLAHVRIRRFDPERDTEPYYQEFDGIPFEARSVLEVLHTVYEEHDSSLAFRRLCTRGFCGSCFVVVNGEPVLSCQFPALPYMTIEPHPKFPVIRDLVVDLEHPIDAESEGAEVSSKAPAPTAGGR
ncbi:MAG: hypothetical protein HYY30_06950 [Chloroflexi bacterium]|nr:hypothetical protein [Chloroflexota bacterium]